MKTLSQKQTLALLCISSIGLIAAAFYELSMRTKMSPSIESLEENCRIFDEVYKIDGNSMSPILESGDTIVGINGYYRCGGVVQREDIIVAEDSALPGPYVKRVKALPGDSLTFGGNGDLFVAGVQMKNSLGEIYSFTRAEQTLLELYIKNGVLQNGAYLIFGENISTSFDSRKIGAISRDAMIAKIILR